MLTALAGCDIDALTFTAEMYGVQLDQLAAVLGVSVERARAVAVRPPRHARALYLCSPAALPAVSQARDELGTLGAG